MSSSIEKRRRLSPEVELLDTAECEERQEELRELLLRLPCDEDEEDHGGQIERSIDHHHSHSRLKSSQQHQPHSTLTPSSSTSSWLYNDSLFGPGGGPSSISPIDDVGIDGEGRRRRSDGVGFLVQTPGADDLPSTPLDFETPYTSVKPGLIARGTSQRMPLENGRRAFGGGEEESEAKHRLFWSPSSVQSSQSPGLCLGEVFQQTEEVREDNEGRRRRRMMVCGDSDTDMLMKFPQKEKGGQKHEEDMEMEHGDGLLASLPNRLPSDPEELHMVVSQLSVALKTSEAKRRHLSLQGQALRNEQGRLMQQVHTLAVHEKELEEHLLLMTQNQNAKAGLSMLDLLRGQMLEAARAEAENAKKDANIAIRERNRAIEERESLVKEGEAVSLALKEEIARLAAQLAQRSVLSAAQERTSKQWEARSEADSQRVEDLRGEIEDLKGDLRIAGDRMEEEIAARKRAEAQAGKEKAAAKSMSERLEMAEKKLAETQAELRALAGEREAERRAKGGEEFESKFTAEVDRMTRMFDAERRALEGEVSKLKIELDQVRSSRGSGGGSIQLGTPNDWSSLQHPSPVESAMESLVDEGNDLSEFIEEDVVSENVMDKGDRVKDMWRERAIQAEAECSRLHQALSAQRGGVQHEQSLASASPWKVEQARHDAELFAMEKIEQERLRLTANFREELNGILNERRRVWEMEKAADIEELRREFEAEKHRNDRERILVIEDFRVRCEEESAVRLADLRVQVVALEDEVARRAQQADAAQVEKDRVMSNQRALALKLIEHGGQIAKAGTRLDDLLERLAEDQQLHDNGILDLLDGVRTWADLRKAQDQKDIRRSTASCEAQTDGPSFSSFEGDKERLTQLVKENLELTECKLRVEHEVASLKARVKLLDGQSRDLSDKQFNLEQEKKVIQAQVKRRDELIFDLGMCESSMQEVIDRLHDDPVVAKDKDLIEMAERLKQWEDRIKARAWKEAKADVMEIEAAKARVARTDFSVQTDDTVYEEEEDDKHSSLAESASCKQLAQEVGEASRAVAEANDMMVMQHEEEMQALKADFEEQKISLYAELLLEKEARVEIMTKLQEMQSLVGSNVEDAVNEARVAWEKEMDKVVRGLREELEVDKEDALKKAYDRFMIEREDMAINSEREQQELNNMNRRASMLERAIDKVSAKSKEQEEALHRTRRELENHQRSFAKEREDLMALVERYQREGTVKSVRIKELESKVDSLKEAANANARRGARNAVSSSYEELEAMERRLRTQHEKEVANAVAITRRELDTEIDVVMVAMKKRYTRKINKMKERWDLEKQSLLDTARGVTTSSTAAAAHFLANSSVLNKTTTDSIRIPSSAAAAAPSRPVGSSSYLDY